jgi:hypothetical protein
MRRGSAQRSQSEAEHHVLNAAAEAGLRAPSIFNTQPWLWRISDGTLELQADRNRQLTVVDPDGQFLTLSCGIALHHARVALRAAGWQAGIDRLPDPGNEDLMARLRLTGPAAARPDDAALYRATLSRRTDRRPYGEESVSELHVGRLVAAAEGEGVRLHPVRPDQMPMLAIAVASAQATEVGDRAYRDEVMRWTNRPQWSNDGVPQATGVARVPRRVPVRNFVWAPDVGMPAEPGGDRGARYLVVHGSTDTPAEWLRAGEGTSAVLLTAVTLGLAAAPLSDVVEVERTRDLVAGLLGGPGTPDGPRRAGRPYLVIRCGHSQPATPVASVPRREASEVIRTD